MIVVENIKNENIAEYIILMYQTEDMIRAYKLDLDLIIEKIAKPQAKSASLLPTITDWYKTIVQEMKSRGLEKKGHLHRVQEVMMELVYLHNSLLTVMKDEKYKGLLERATPHIEAFREKSDLKKMHPVEISFHALYMKLLMRLQKKEISAETEEAFDNMRILVAYLSKTYHNMRSQNGEATH